MVLTELVTPLQQLITEAGEEIMAFYLKSRQFNVTAKADDSPLTQADLASNEILINGLTKLTPDWPILSEETPKPPLAVRQHWERYWCIDPLDGTREFIRHSGEFVVNIALIEAHQPILGLIYAPAYEQGFYAIKGHGAFRWQADKQEAIQARPWQIAKTKLLTSRGAKIERLNKYFGAFGDFSWDPGGSAIKFCRIAEGAADAYPRFGDTCEWDTAAGQIILEEAGGAVVDFNWQPLRYNGQEQLINPHFIAVGDVQFIEQLKGEDVWQNNE